MSRFRSPKDRNGLKLTYTMRKTRNLSVTRIPSVRFLEDYKGEEKLNILYFDPRRGERCRSSLTSKEGGEIKIVYVHPGG